jgi:hypothetical protein
MERPLISGPKTQKISNTSPNSRVPHPNVVLFDVRVGILTLSHAWPVHAPQGAPPFAFFETTDSKTILDLKVHGFQPRRNHHQIVIPSGVEGPLFLDPRTSFLRNGRELFVGNIPLTTEPWN